MEIVFKGNRYNFKIFNMPISKRQNIFYIKAIHKETRRTSFITNVNAILSGLNISSNSRIFWETEWVLNKRKADEISLSAEEFISDKEFLPYLEQALDLDRKESEWENYE